MGDFTSALDRYRRSIRYESYSMSIGELASMYERSELDIHPDFQRLYRWTARQKVNFVESVLMHIPLPGIYVAQRPDAVWDVIDGLQRLSTVFEFMGILRNADGSTRSGLPLLATEIMPELEGVHFEERLGNPALRREQQIDFRRQKIDVKIILNESDPDAKYDLFTRLNTGGTPLSPQEVRIAVMLMKNSSLFPFTLTLQGDQRFRRLSAFTKREEEERFDNELVLRWLMLSRLEEDGLQTIRDDEDALSNRRLLDYLEDPDLDFDRDQATFDRVFAGLSQLGDGAFRSDQAAGDGGIDFNLFDGIAVAAGKVTELIPERLSSTYTALREAPTHLSVAERVRQGARGLNGLA